MDDVKKPEAVTRGARVEPPARIEVETAFLSPALARSLARTPKEEWSKIDAVRCQVRFTRDMTAGIRFVDSVANVINQRGGLFSTQDVRRRRELEDDSQKIVDAFRSLIARTVEVARKLGMTQLLERNWRFLSTYGPPPEREPETPGGRGPDYVQGRESTEVA